MKLLRCTFEDGSPRPAVRQGESVVDLTETELVDTETQHGPFAEALERINESGDSCLKEAVADAPDSAFSPNSEVDLVAPVASGGRFFAFGGVYAQHLRERDQSLNKVPSQWVVPETAIVGPNEPIVLPDRVSESVMPAVELCLVIGKGGQYIRETSAMDHIAGYTVSNDVTARTDWPGPMAYKLMDTFSPCGPGVVPSAQVGDVTDLEMTMTQGGHSICRGSTASMRFTLTFLVSFLSSVLELRPGDVISTGDPGRVEEGLHVGETVRASIENVGELENPVHSSSITHD